MDQIDASTFDHKRVVMSSFCAAEYPDRRNVHRLIILSNKPPINTLNPMMRVCRLALPALVVEGRKDLKCCSSCHVCWSADEFFPLHIEYYLFMWRSDIFIHVTISFLCNLAIMLVIIWWLLSITSTSINDVTKEWFTDLIDIINNLQYGICLQPEFVSNVMHPSYHKIFSTFPYCLCFVVEAYSW